MKRIILIIAIICSTYLMQAQSFTSYKKENSTNKEVRTSMLDQLRNKMYTEYNLETTFVVKTFKSDGNYAWLMVDVANSNGKPIKLNDPAADCCHAEALYERRDDIWVLVEHAAFSTDVWWETLATKYIIMSELFKPE